MPTTKTKRTKFPPCKRLGLLREPNGRDHLFFPVVVSSSALHDHLGAKKYRAFIEHLESQRGGRSSGQPNVGFAPAIVEAWLKRGSTR